MTGDEQPGPDTDPNQIPDGDQTGIEALAAASNTEEVCETLQDLNVTTGENNASLTANQETPTETTTQSAQRSISTTTETSLDTDTPIDTEPQPETTTGPGTETPSTPQPPVETGTPNTQTQAAVAALFDDKTVDERRVLQELAALVTTEPRTVRELQAELDTEHGLSRDQIEYRLDKLVENNIINAKKGPGRTSPRIFWVNK